MCILLSRLAHWCKRITLSILYFGGLRDSNLNDRTYKAFSEWTTNDEIYDVLCFSFLGEETQLKDLQRAGSKFTIKDVSKDCRRWIPPRVKCLHNECHIWTKKDQNRESHTLSINTSRQSENFQTFPAICSYNTLESDYWTIVSLESLHWLTTIRLIELYFSVRSV